MNAELSRNTYKSSWFFIVLLLHVWFYCEKDILKHKSFIIFVMHGKTSFLFFSKNKNTPRSCWLWLFKEQFVLIITLLTKDDHKKTVKYLPSTQESCDKFTAKRATATPCFFWETWLSLTLTRWEKIPIHPNSQAGSASLAIWYHSNEEQMVIQVQDIFFAALFFLLLLCISLCVLRLNTGLRFSNLKTSINYIIATTGKKRLPGFFNEI